MSENFKTIFHVGINKSIDQIVLQNIIKELKSKNIEIELKDNFSDKFIIKQLLTNEEIEMVHKTFISHGINGEHKPVS